MSGKIFMGTAQPNPSTPSRHTANEEILGSAVVFASIAFAFVTLPSQLATLDFRIALYIVYAAGGIAIMSAIEVLIERTGFGWSRASVQLLVVGMDSPAVFFKALVLLLFAYASLFILILDHASSA